MPRRFVFPIFVMLLVIGGQAWVSASSLITKVRGGHYHARSWPLLDYPMYSSAKGPDVTTSEASLHVRRPDGTEFEIGPPYLGLQFFALRYHVIERLAAAARPDDPYHDAVEADRREAWRRVVDAVTEREGHPPVAVWIERRTHTLINGAIEVTDQRTDVAAPAGEDTR